MTRHQIIKIIISTLRLRLNTIRDKVARMNFRLALRFPQKYKIFGDPMVKKITIIIAALTALGAAFGLTSCNVTRTITTKSEYWQKADTSVVIQTKTIETYDASKKGIY